MEDELLSWKQEDDVKVIGKEKCTKEREEKTDDSTCSTVSNKGNIQAFTNVHV